MLYLDTSVLVSALTKESQTRDVQDWLAGYDLRSCAISDWTETEFASAISIKLRSRNLDLDDGMAASLTFQQLIHETLVHWPVAVEDFRIATAFAKRHELGLRSGDALHLAICAARGAVVGTRDARMAQAGLAVGVHTILV